MARVSVAATPRADDGRRQRIIKLIFNVITIRKKAVLPHGATPVGNKREKREGTRSAPHKVDRPHSENETAAAMAPINGSNTLPAWYHMIPLYVSYKEYSALVLVRYEKNSLGHWSGERLHYTTGCSLHFNLSHFPIRTGKRFHYTCHRPLIAVDVLVLEKH